MKRLFIILLLIMCAFSTASAAESGKADPRNMTFPELRFDIPKAERVILECGAPVYLLRDTELPIISVAAMVKTGIVYDPAQKTGLAGMTGSAMRNGGAGGMTPQELDEELEFMASTVESVIGEDMGAVSMTTLVKNFDRTLVIFKDILLRPDFNKKRVELIRKQTLEKLRRQNDDPRDIADRELISAIYAGHPLGKTPDFKSIASITRNDMVMFHKRFFSVGNMILVVSGDFQREEIIQRLNSIFRDKTPDNFPVLDNIPQPELDLRPEIIYARKDTSQTAIRMGRLGLSKDNPDLYAVRVLDYILGGGFASRLTMEIRTNRGLAYNVGSHFDIGRRFTGTFVAETETKTENTAMVIGLLKDIIAELTKEEVSDQELQSAKDYIINSFMFGFTTPASVVTQQARLEYYGYPDEYLENYRDNILKVTKQDVLAAAHKYLSPDIFKIVVVGNPAKFDKPLTTFGPARELDLKLNTSK